MPHRERNIGYQQALMEDASVFSHQWIILPASCRGKLSPDLLLDRYFSYIRRFTLSLVRPLRTTGMVEFRFLTFPFSLISFSGPHLACSADVESAELSICGGFLVQQEACNRGNLRFTIHDTRDHVRVDLRLTDYCPLILGGEQPSRVRKWLYRFTQAYIHKVVTVRFLARVYGEVTGTRPPMNVVRSSVLHGEDI